VIPELGYGALVLAWAEGREQWNGDAKSAANLFGF